MSHEADGRRLGLKATSPPAQFGILYINGVGDW
jgi:hypothetical protein